MRAVGGDNPIMSDPDIILRAAFAHHQAGDLPDASNLYRQVLALRPADHDALHLLGVASAALGNPAGGIALIQQAIALKPAAAVPHFNLGGLLATQGRPKAALEAFQACLALSPNHVGALAASARLLHTLGRSAESVDAYARALVLTPGDGVLWSDLAATLYAGSRLDEALQAYEQLLRLRPGDAEAHCNRGAVLLRRQAYEAAEGAFRTALVVQPNHRGASLNLGFALIAQARGEDALAALDRVLTLDPVNFPARLQRGLLLNALGRHVEAVRALTTVLDIAPDHRDALAARGSASWVLRDWEWAEADLERALKLDPDYVPALIDRGNLAHDCQQYDAAVAYYDRALALQADNLTAVINRAGSLQSAQRHAAALAGYREALRLSPGHDEALMGIGLCQLRAGAWREGWQRYETRRRQSLWLNALPTFSGPPWDGVSDPRGKRVLVVSEQGLGDTIQFCRFAGLLADRGARVVLGVEKPLRRLMQGLSGVAEIAVQGEADPAYDLYVPLMSLPAIFELDMDAVATDGPYLRADPDAAAGWRARLAALPGLKVGLAWAGAPRLHDRTASLMDGRRSIALEQLARLLAVAGVTFVSLQKGLPVCPPIVDWAEELDDFADTAALIDGLDLVISVDTAVAHVAGALGKPVWLLNRFDRCWRWMWERTDTPWYPTMRLFTQTVPGVWDDVVAEVAADLAVSATPR